LTHSPLLFPSITYPFPTFWPFFMLFYFSSTCLQLLFLGAGLNCFPLVQPLSAHYQSHSVLTLFHPLFYFNFILCLFWFILSFYVSSLLSLWYIPSFVFILFYNHIYFILCPFYLCFCLSSLTHLLSLLLHSPPPPTSAFGITFTS
jgi:hypothetical protein